MLCEYNVCTLIRTMATKRDTRNHRWNFRVAADEDALVRAASLWTETSFTSFVREAAVSEARQVLADRRRFELDEPDWERFNKLLERPARVPAGLRELFSKQSAFE
ncbi:MAG: DUF1778 domain-containing protein [Solirubrobacterales bacterium]|nr:DUF1778 domain-containing protein [Solirubrobacterales bacterium]